MNDVSNIYDHLLDYESSQKKGFYPIHKNLRLDNDQDDLIDWLINNVSFKAGESILDAGCGTGYTLFRLAKEKMIIGLGISISENEVNYARDSLNSNSDLLPISFKKQGFDEPNDIKFDKIIAIESLKHSKDLHATIRNFHNCTADNGTIIIADDYILKSSMLTNFQKRLWNSPSFTSIIELEKIFSKIGHFKLQKNDFTNQVKTKSLFLLVLLIPVIYLARWFYIKRKRINIDTFLGGLLLEFLYKTKSVSYAIIIATKCD